MNTQETTREHLNKLIEFRQAIYRNGLSARRDALFNVLDALLSTGSVSSFAMLSQSERFERKWPSLYAAVADGQVNQEWLRRFLTDQTPRQGICIFPLDGSSWARPRSRTLDDLQYVYQASSDVNGGTVTIGYPYSLLEWCAEAHSSWSLPLDVRRIPSEQTAQDIGVAQIQALAKARSDCTAALDIVTADGKYGHSGFLCRIQGLRVGAVTRLRRDRVLYRAAPPPTGKRGRPRIHGARFAFKEESTWGAPAETWEFEAADYGTVRLERWNTLHDGKNPPFSFDVLRARIHQERAKPPAAIWLAWLAPPVIPPNIAVTAQTLWDAYTMRWPIEPALQFRKAHLDWTLPRFQHKGTGDTWSALVALAHWSLFLARPIVADMPLPWQKPQARLTPQRVRQSLKPIFALIGTPALPPKTRGKSPGWPKGKPRTPKERFKVVKKRPVAPQSA